MKQLITPCGVFELQDVKPFLRLYQGSVLLLQLNMHEVFQIQVTDINLKLAKEFITSFKLNRNRTTHYCPILMDRIEPYMVMGVPRIDNV